MKERRIKPRIPGHFSVFIEVQAPIPGVDDSQQLVKGQCVDISENGLQISAQAPLRPEAILRVFVIDKDDAPVALAGEVRWTCFKHGRFNAGLNILPSETTQFREWRMLAQASSEAGNILETH